MIEINLLPEELRKKKKAQRFKTAELSDVDLSGLDFQKLKGLIKDIPAIRWTVVSIGTLIAFHIILFSVGIYGKVHFYSLTKKYNAILPQKKEADILRAQSESINSKVNAINELMVKRFSWARKLNALSDSMASGVWLSELSYENTVSEKAVQPTASKPGAKVKKGASTEKTVLNYLTLAGYTSQMGESGAALVGKFIKGLKSNTLFYSDFNDINLVSIKSDKVDEQEVMNFKIICAFKENKE